MRDLGLRSEVVDLVRPRLRNQVKNEEGIINVSEVQYQSFTCSLHHLLQDWQVEGVLAANTVHNVRGRSRLLLEEKLRCHIQSILTRDSCDDCYSLLI